VWRCFAAFAPHSTVISATLSTGNDLTGGYALPMFASAWVPHLSRLEGKKAKKSSGYQ
jgi:hypothetical protein